MVIANGSVNCDNAHSVGINSKEGMIDKTFADVKLVFVHPQQVLNRILSIPDSATDLAVHVKYELAPRPSSLFDDMPMKRPSMAALAPPLLSCTTWSY